MSWTDNLAITMGTLVVWGFLMAFCLNVFLRVISATKDNYLVFVGLVMFLSYYFSDLFHDLNAGPEIYLTWFVYDIGTLIAVLSPLAFFRLRIRAPIIYIYIGLVINAILFLAMYIDMYILSTSEPWMLWHIYSFTVNVIDYGMIVTLIIGKDWLGLARLARFIKGKVRAKKAALAVKNKGSSHSLLQA